MLPLNSERMVSFPAKSIRVKIPAEIQGKVAVLSNDGVLYLNASEEFSAQQVLVQDKVSKKIIILSLSANKELGSSEKLAVLLADSEDGTDSDVGANSGSSGSTSYVGYEDLVRMAAKHLYAPERLITIPANTSRVHVKRSTDTRLIRGNVISMVPAISFNNEGLYVTAVKLTNLEKRKVVLDPRDVRGKWLAASFQHVVLGPKGTETDTTALYLVSERPFWEAY